MADLAAQADKARLTGPVKGHPSFMKKANICFDCEKSCGRCSWSGIDEETGKPKFEPVPGWTAEKTKIQMKHSALRPDGTRKLYITMTDTYQITACPEFEPTKTKRKEKADG